MIGPQSACSSSATDKLVASFSYAGVTDPAREWAFDFLTEPQIGAELSRRTQAAGTIHLDWITADERYGQNGKFLDLLEAQQQRYLVEVPVSTTVWTEDPASAVPPYQGQGHPPTRAGRQAVHSVVEVTATWPAAAWQALQVREGTKGPLVFQFAAVRVWAVRHRRPGPPIWLMVRRSLGPEVETKYYVSNTAADVPLEDRALVTGCRYRVEEFLEEGKSYLGMAQYEARAWSSWHHHRSLVGLAHLFVTLTRVRLK
jgi:SRSO17 transposase